jgi:ubiquinone/menaquinone biosynthesis C-methylase UbiE
MSRPWDQLGRTPEFHMHMRALLGRLGHGSGQRLLDIGCGTGRWAAALARDGWRVVGIDFATGMLRRARVRTQEIGPDAVILVRADLRDGLPFSAGVFDVALCVAVLHTVVEPSTALDEIRRVLRPGGTLAIALPSLLPTSRRPGTFAGALLEAPRWLPGWRQRVQTARQGDVEALLARAGFDVGDAQVIGSRLSILARRQAFV